MTDEAEFNGFYAIYWLMKHAVSLSSTLSLLKLLDKCGAATFPYKHFDSFREIMKIISDTLLDEIIDDIKDAATFSVLIDDVTDITSKEQCILFIQYYSKSNEKVEARFINIASLLDETTSTSADADTIYEVLKTTLKCKLSFHMF